MSWGTSGKQFSIKEQADMIQFCRKREPCIRSRRYLWRLYYRRNFWKRVDKKWGFKEPIFS